MIYDDNQRELLAKQDIEAVKNTYYRMPVVSPNKIFKEDHIVVNTMNYPTGINLYKIDEVILYIIGVFKFAPFWLVNQWYKLYGRDGNLSVAYMVKVGIVWLEASALGIMIRPTQWLFKELDIEEQYRYWLDIPFNLMNHTCAEEQIVFDIMMGNEKSDLWREVQKIPNLFPCYHPFKIKPSDDKGTIIMQESYFHDNLSSNEEEPPKTEEEKKERNTRAKKENDFALSVLGKQDEIIKGIREGRPYTLEFQDQSLLTLVPKNFGIDKNAKMQRPDSAILVPRSLGKPQSVAIELELTLKTGVYGGIPKYEVILDNYKNNLIYGTLIYLCANGKIREAVIDAYNKLGGLGSCRLLVIPYTSPAQELQDMADKELETQQKIQKVSEQTTKGGN